MLRRYEIAHRSMSPLLEPGDYVIARRLRRPARGDVVIVEHPERPGLELVKRVIGLPGEHIVIGEYGVHIDGVGLDEPWAHGATTPSGAWDTGDGWFVLGDQRLVSTDDSRTIGPIPSSSGVWKVMFRYWPHGRIGTVSRRAG